MSKISYDSYEFDTQDLPEASVLALLSRGLTHFLGNEQAAKVTAKIRAHLRNGKGKDFEVNRDMVQAFRAPGANDELIAEWMKEAQTKAVDALIAGTVGEQTRSARTTPIEREMVAVAKEMIRNGASKEKVPMPKGENLADLIDDLCTGPHATQIRASAEKRLADAAALDIKINFKTT